MQQRTPYDYYFFLAQHRHRMQTKRVTAPKPQAAPKAPSSKLSTATVKPVAITNNTTPTCTRKISDNPPAYCNTPLIVKIKNPKKGEEGAPTDGAEYW